MSKRRSQVLGCSAALAAFALVASCAGGSASPVVGSTTRVSPTPGAASSGGSPSSVAASPLAPGVALPLRSDEPRGAAGPAVAAGTALDQLGAALLDQLPATDNAVLSPYSVYTVLAMARAGAKGTTGTQLDAVLGGGGAAQTGNVTAIDQAVAAALAAGKPPAGADPSTADTRPVTVEVANSVWLSPDRPVRPSYLDTLAAGFGVGMYQVNYQADPDAARKTINAWVGDHTNGLIPELLGDGTVSTDTVMTLVNALYLSAPWQNQFTKSAAPMPFTNGAGEKTVAPAMSAAAGFGSATGDGWTSVTITYRGGGLAMSVVLPDAGSFDAVRAELPKVLETATGTQSPTPVELTMPLFKADVHLSLKAAMEALGVKDLFTPAADLSGIAGSPGEIMAEDLVHQAVITVDEKGTEAAAATAMTAVATSALGGTRKVTVDRPFFYAVHDTTTGAPLFLGQVTDPTR